MAEPVDDAAFRHVLGRFASGITVTSTVADGVDHALTASAFCSVSMDPRLVMVAVDRKNRFHEAVLASGSWGVSVLSLDAHAEATWFATRGRPLERQFEAFDHHRGPRTGVALLDHALGWLECETWRTYDGGDHTMVVGEVVAARSRDDVDAPLLYYRSHYGSVVRSDQSEKNQHPHRSS